MNLLASPTPHDVIIDRDQDLNHKITLPMGSYLVGGAAAWTLYYELTHPTTGAVIFSKTSGGGGIVVTTAGSASVDALFTVSLADTDLPNSGASALSRNIKYNWLFKRTDPDVNIDGGTIKFRR